MSRRKSRIVLFEDDPKARQRLLAGIKKSVGPSFDVIPFEAPRSDVPRTDAYEDRIREALGSRRYAHTRLVVCDRDLSRIEDFTGLSEAAVSNAVDDLGIPVCLYAQGVSDDILTRQRNWGDGRIVLDSSDIKRMVRVIGVLAAGFASITENTKAAKGASKLAEWMAAIMGKPEAASHIALYGIGDQKMLVKILPDRKRADASGAALRKRLPSLLGYWLYDSILRFPGLLVNAVAAASHMNIDARLFESEPRIRTLFKSAQYKGPFADPEAPLWWRAELDDIVFSAGFADGREFVGKRLKREVDGCHCSLDPNARAGYYCMATQLPVSLQNSHGDIAWFPQGADLARIRNDVYDEIAPWLGIV